MIEHMVILIKSRHVEIVLGGGYSVWPYMGKYVFEKTKITPTMLINLIFPLILAHARSANALRVNREISETNHSWIDNCRHCSGILQNCFLRQDSKIYIRTRNWPSRTLQTQKHRQIRHLRDPNPLEDILDQYPSNRRNHIELDPPAICQVFSD